MTHPENERTVRELFAREAGWKYVRDEYEARLAADFSASELQELLKLSRQPVMKRLLQSEIRAYTDTNDKRHRLGFQVWDNYNRGKFKPPAGI
jgi:hypothetical protein